MFLEITLDKRFEQMDKRFDKNDERFDAMLKRQDRQFYWVLGFIATGVGLVITALRYLKPPKSAQDVWNRSG